MNTKGALHYDLQKRSAMRIAANRGTVSFPQDHHEEALFRNIKLREPPPK